MPNRSECNCAEFVGWKQCDNNCWYDSVLSAVLVPLHSRQLWWNRLEKKYPGFEAIVGSAGACESISKKQKQECYHLMRRTVVSKFGEPGNGNWFLAQLLNSTDFHVDRLDPSTKAGFEYFVSDKWDMNRTHPIRLPFSASSSDDAGGRNRRRRSSHRKTVNGKQLPYFYDDGDIDFKKPLPNHLPQIVDSIRQNPLSSSGSFGSSGSVLSPISKSHSPVLAVYVQDPNTSDPHPLKFKAYSTFRLGNHKFSLTAILQECNGHSTSLLQCGYPSTYIHYDNATEGIQPAITSVLSTKPQKNKKKWSQSSKKRKPGGISSLNWTIEFDGKHSCGGEPNVGVDYTFLYSCITCSRLQNHGKSH